MHGHDGRPTIRVLQEVMTPAHAKYEETVTIRRRDQLSSRPARRTGHQATRTRWTPTNSRRVTGAPSASRHTVIASWIRFIQDVERTSLGVASAQRRNRPDVPPRGIALDHDIEFARAGESACFLGHAGRTADIAPEPHGARLPRCRRVLHHGRVRGLCVSAGAPRGPRAAPRRSRARRPGLRRRR